MHAEELRSFAHRLVCQLVDQPEAVEVYLARGEQDCHLWIRMAPMEIGMVVGRGGRNIDSIRKLVYAYAAKLHTKIHIDVLEPGTSYPPT